MTASPVNIRNTVAIPFPPLVRGAAPIAVAKANGIWTISLDVADLAAHVPSVADLAAEYWIVWDQTRGTYFKVALSAIGVAGARLQRYADASASGNVITVAANDQWINFKVAAASTCALPAAATRNGAPLTFYNVDGTLTAGHKLTLTPAGGETIGGAASVDMTTARALVTLTPMNDGTNTGWALQ